MEPPVPCILLRASAKYPTKLRRNYPRSRSGCLTCRQRKKKCDEAHPQCAGCLRNQLSCVWPVGRTAHRDRHEAKTDGRQKDSTLTEQAGHSQGDQASQASQASQAKDIPASQSSQSGSTPDNVSCCAIASAVALLRRPTRPLLAWEERRADGSRDESPPAEDPPEADVTWSPGLGAFSAAALPVEARRVAAMTPLSATMLRAFIVRTAGELAITAGPANPFLAAVLPLAYSDDLVMHCVVALGGANLSAETALRRERTGSDQALVLALGVPSLHEATTRHYACVLRSLRAALRSLQPADTPQVLRTLLVLLLLAIYECSSWNVLDGGVFAHLGAARQLVAWLRAAPSVGTADDEALFGALLEVYAYLVLANRVTPDGALDHVRRVVGPDGSAADEDFVRDPALLAPGHPYAGVRLAGLHKLMALIPPVSHLAGLARQSAQISSRRLRARAAILRRRAAAWQLPAACLAQAQNDQDLVWWRAMGEVYRHALLVYLETAEMEGTRDDDDDDGSDNDDDNNNPGSPDSLDASSDLPPLAEANLQRYIEAIGQATLATGLVASRFVSIALWPLVVIGTVLDRDSERSYLLDGLRSIPAFWGAIRAADLLELQWRCRDAAAAARPPKTVCQGLPAYYGPSGLARVMRENKINLCIY